MPMMQREDHQDPTASEREALWFVARGWTDAQIAAELLLSEAAVHKRIERFSARTGLSGRMLVAWAAEHVDCCLSANSA